MKITIDLRSLSSGTVSGVENYALNLVEHLLPLDKKNSYTLFYNSLKLPKVDLNFINSKTVITRYPNKLLNVAFKFGAVELEKITGPADWVFMPNLNPIHLHHSTKLAVTVHDLSFLADPKFYDTKRRLWHYFLNVKKILHRANAIFAVSEYTKYDLVKRLQVPEHKIKTIYSGIDQSVFSRETPVPELRAFRNKMDLPGNFLLSLGTIEPRKNAPGLIKAFEKLDGPEWLVIAGKAGWSHQPIFQQIKKSKKSKKIKYLGYVAEAEKPLLIKLAQALVYPSFYEGFGFPPLESIASGVPVVASQVTSLPEVLKDAALLVNPYSVDSIAEGVRKILTDVPLREMLIEKGRQRVKQFSWDAAAQQVMEEFK
jgi:glycosyltransferase involved in cell wall biosynthesis